jgi:hypothetical protein
MPHLKTYIRAEEKENKYVFSFRGNGIEIDENDEGKIF